MTIEVLHDSRIVPISNGYRLQETDAFVVEVWQYLFNYRLIVRLRDDPVSVEHGYCYFGRGLESLARAVAAGLEWTDPLNAPPRGFDKQAF